MTDITPSYSTDLPESTSPTLEGDSNESILAAMRAEASQSIEVEDISLVVPERSNFELLFKPYIDYDLLNSMMKKARKSVGGGKKEWHPLAFAHSVMSHTTTGVAFKGTLVQDSDGDDLTITSPEFHSMFEARSLAAALKALYVHDGHIIATSQKIVEEAGYGDIDVESGEGGPLDN